MRSGGGSFGQISLHVGADWWTFLNTYDDHSPILDVAAGSTTVTFTIADRKADDSALEFARELASQAAQFAAEVERLHAQHSQDSGTGKASTAAPGTVRPLDGDQGWGGRNGHSCRPGCLPPAGAW